MDLTLNLGNSRIACAHQGRVWHFENTSSATHVFDVIKSEISDVKTVTIGSVVPTLTCVFLDAATLAFPGVRIDEITATSPVWSFTNKTNHPARVGVDRLANAEATIQMKFLLPAVIVDLGTATTFSVLNARAEFIGGAITLGLTSSRNALASRAAQLFEVALKAPRSVIGADSETAIQSGLLYGHAALIDGMVERISKELSHPKPSVVITGGGAPVLQALLKTDTTHVADLTLKGLTYAATSLRR